LTKKKGTNLTLKRPNLLLFQGSRPAPPVSLLDFVFSSAGHGRFSFSLSSRFQHHLHPFLHAISPFFLHLSTAAPHSIFLHTSRCSPLTSFSFGFSFPSASSPTHGQADHYSSNNPSSPPKTETGRPFAFGFFFFQQ